MYNEWTPYNWSPGRRALQRHLVATREVDRFRELYERAMQESLAAYDEARAFLKEHGPVPVRFNNDDRIYEAVTGTFGSIVLKVKEETGAWPL